MAKVAIGRATASLALALFTLPVLQARSFGAADAYLRPRVEVGFCR